MTRILGNVLLILACSLAVDLVLFLSWGYSS